MPSILLILTIALLFLVANTTKLTPFILYGGMELPLNETNITGECWTLSAERCVRQQVNLLNYTSQNLLICPESYYPTEIDCEKAYGLIVEEKPKINCYYIDEDTCKTEQFLQEEGCPSAYYTSEEECKEALRTPLHHIGKLFKNKLFLIFAVLLVGLLIYFLRK